MLLLIHGAAGSHDKHAPEILKHQDRWPAVRIEACDSPSAVIERARAAVDGGEDTLIAGGGDGTVSTVVNAVADRLDRVRIGVVPLGTGNDFARTLGMPLDPLEALDAIASSEIDTVIDLVQVTASDRSVLCLNHASGGFGGVIEEVVDGTTKRRWGGLAYVRAGADAALVRPAWDVALELDSLPVEERRLVNVVVANGRTAGGGFAVAPGADPADRRLDVVLVDEASTLDLAAVVARLLTGDYTESAAVHVRRAARVTVRSVPPMPFSVDGELFASTPLTFRVLPHALRIVGLPR